jgi:predicted permease
VPYLNLLATIFLNNVVPIFLVAAAGFAIGRALRPDVATVSRLAFYIFSPCLVFSVVARSELSATAFTQMAVAAVALLLIMAGLAFAVGRGMRLPRHVLAALVISAVFINGGNMGLAVVQFAYGDAALAHATVFFAFSTLMVYTLGVAIASLGHQSARAMLRQAATLPTTYALVAAGALRVTGTTLPLPIDRAVTLLAQATIPTMLILLGMQMAAIRAWPRARLRLVAVATGLQLVVAPLVGLALAALLGLDGPARQAAITEAAMPAAVFSTILAVEYRLDTELVSSTVVISTLLSPLVLVPLIAFLQT